MRVAFHADLRGRPVTVVGAGRAGYAKADRLRSAGADVRLVDTIDPADEQLTGSWIVVTATGDEAANDDIQAAAETQGIWVNRADKADGGPLAFAASIDRGDVQVSVSTGGASPAMAKWLRDRIEAAVPPEAAELAEILAARPRDPGGDRSHRTLPFDDALAALQAGDRAAAEELLA